MRQLRLDAFRLYAIALIVVAHVQYFGGTDEASPLALRLLQFVGVTLPRYSIPFFFILAGYFTGGKIVREPEHALETARRYTWRLGAIFLVWCAVYAVESPQIFLYLLREYPVTLLLDGSRVHLWFLVSMILTVWLFVLWPFDKKGRSFLWLGGALYVFGLLAGSYRATPLGFDLHFNPRDGVFFGTLFFGIGVYFSMNRPQVSVRTSLALAAGGLLLFCAEVAYLRVFWKVGAIKHDFLIGTIPFGMGVTLLAFARADTSLDKRLGPYGRYTLGIYGSHLLFVDWYRPLGAWVNPYLWQVLYAAMVFGSALLFSVVLEKTPLRKLVC